MDLTLGAALLAGLISFLSPCVLPVVPAYLGQLGVASASSPFSQPVPGLVPVGASVTGRGDASHVPATRLRASWRAMPNALAFVLGFTLVFTVLGVTAYVVAGPLRENLPLLRQLGGVLLIILGLNLMGVLRLRTLAAILTMAAVGSSPQVVGLLVAYSIGLGIPFLLMALAMDRAPLVTRALLRYSRQIEIVGGALVVVLGFALIFDWLGLFARQLSFLWPSV